MTFYSSLKSTAEALILKYGQPVTFARVDSEVYDPNSGGRELNTTSTYTVNAVSYPVVNGQSSEKLNDEYDVRLIATDANYAKGDTCMYNGRTHNVVSFEPISPGSVTMCYYVDLQL